MAHGDGKIIGALPTTTEMVSSLVGARLVDGVERVSRSAASRRGFAARRGTLPALYRGRRFPMAEDTGSGNSSIVAIFAILMIVLIGALIAWQMGVIGGGGKKQLDINVKTGQLSEPAR
jgi:hypothetical protein